MRLIKRIVYIVAALAPVALAALWWMLWASLPVLDGALALTGLEAPVDIERDALGTVTIRARNRRDAARATGFVHAQDRFFQMDLIRRSAAGELSALVGAAAIAHDRERRLHRLRTTAREVVDRASSRVRAIAEAYADGINAGLAALSARPFEYFVLGARPQPWLPEDTVLAIFAMYFLLHDETNARESRLGLMHDALPPEMFEYLTQEGTEWDAPLVGRPGSTPSLPGVEICDLRRVDRGRLAAGRGWRYDEDRGEGVMAGSNAWAVSAARSRRGKAMVANDMHLPLGLPNTWYRLRLLIEENDADNGRIEVTGVTLPGTPAMVAGSNGNVAWGLTNSEGDWVDLVVLEIDPTNPRRYRTPQGYREFQEHREIIEVRGSGDQHVIVRTTLWGPVIDHDARGRPRALRWLAHDPEATNLELLAMERARDVSDAVQVAHRTGIPPQNLMLADADGNIAWTIIGRIPRREGYDPRLPSSWAEGRRGWFGWLASDDYPRVVNPRAGAVWTANARVVSGEAVKRIGDGGYALGARARQIRDRLLIARPLGMNDMLAIQLDDRALFLERWRALLLELLKAESTVADPRRARLRRTLAQWQGHASVDAVGYRLVREFRRHVRQRVFDVLIAGCGELDRSFRYVDMHQSEGALWQLVRERPAHLLDPRFDSWNEFLLAAADAALQSCGESDLQRCTWGEVNTVHIRHALTRGLPLLSPWLDMAPQALPGDRYMPRVQVGVHGASERFAVSPGDEQYGYFHMPGGQSGHPLSPFYARGHRDWTEGRASAFLPGVPEHRLRLLPARR